MLTIKVDRISAPTYKTVGEATKHHPDEYPFDKVLTVLTFVQMHFLLPDEYSFVQMHYEYSFDKHIADLASLK
jgi:hypothetical protein